ncbi:MAG: hypothetical protein QOD63_2788 [Actinomycetota bacterium]|nr:hypothetical protein [Actinomycetota bacterium]
MRIAIDLRILAVGPRHINRGMPRFTQQQLRNVLAIDHDNEYLVLTREGEDLSLVDPAIRTAHNAAICHPSGWSIDEPGHPESMLRRSAEFQDWLVAQGVELYHATTPFLFVDPFPVDFDACPMVATFYDAIPLIYPQHYLPEQFQQAYSCCLAAVLRSDRLQAISVSARRDASVYVGFPRNRIDLVSPVADDCFRPLDDRRTWRALAAIGARVRIPRQFVLTVSSTHHSKNAETLLRAYALLDEPLRVKFPLVFCCHLDDAGRALVWSLAEDLGIADDVIVTDMVTDLELAALYNAATVVVHPSRYEGFGLPVLEAMRCGTPVITTTASSLPEVGGDAAALVDPEDAAAMAGAMADVLADPDRREEMARAGLVNAGRFTGEALGRATLASYDRTVAAAAAAEAKPDAGRLRLAVWAPLPPEQTGIADYTVELLAGLTRRADVEVFVNEGFLPDVDLMARYRVHEHHAFERRRKQVGFDAVIYQVGGSFFHWYMHEAMEKYPGIVDLHELSWSHLLYAYSELHGDVEGFRDELAEMEGDLALRCFDAIEEGPPSLRQEFLDTYPMLGRIVAASPALVVHYDGARREIEDRYPGARVRTVVMGVADPYTGPAWRDCALARRSLGLPTGAYVIGVFGILHQTKRVEAVLEALPALLSENPGAVVLVVGRAHDPRYLSMLADMARQLGVERSVRFLGEVDRRVFDGALVACDVVVNLRESTVTHLSATLMRAMAAGKPVVTSAGAGWDFLPDDACVRIASEGALAGELCRLGGDPTLRVRMGEAARRYFEEEATVDVMARRYLEVVDAVRAKAQPVKAAQ